MSWVDDVNGFAKDVQSIYGTITGPNTTPPTSQPPQGGVTPGTPISTNPPTANGMNMYLIGGGVLVGIVLLVVMLKK